MSPPRHPLAAIEPPDELQEAKSDQKITTEDGVETSVKSDNVTVAMAEEDAALGAKGSITPENEHQFSSTIVETPITGGHTNETLEDLEHPTDHVVLSEASKTEGSQSNMDEAMASSIATLKPVVVSPGDEKLLSPVAAVNVAYLDPTPKTPGSSQPVSRSTSSSAGMLNHVQSTKGDRSPTRSDAGFDEAHSGASEDEREKGSRSEIQSIMDQFSEEGGGPGEEEVMSPRLEVTGTLLGPVQHPPRKSSLEPLRSQALQSLEDLRLSSNSPRSFRAQSIHENSPAVPPKPGSIHSFSPGRTSNERFTSVDSPMSPTGGSSLHRPPPPEPEPEPDLPFDFHRFLEQLKHRSADPVAKFLRSFLGEFGKKQWMVHEQVKIIGDFLAFITNKMAQCEVWREVSDAEFDNAREGMEKLVMNRLYTQTFSPAIPPPQPLPGVKSRRKNIERPLGPGRRGQHQEDVERDAILAQKVSIYGWIKEEHLEIEPVGDSGRRFLVLAQQELLKIKTYRAPRDKIICVLNCCKVIFGLLKHSKSDSSADSFMPLLIYVVLQANPDHLVSNVQYILRFRNQDKLGGEAGYYLSSLMGAVQFIENLDRTTLTISDEDFEKHVEAAVSAIAEKHQAEEASMPQTSLLSEKGTAARQDPSSRHMQRPSYDGESSTPRRSTSSYETENGDGMDEKSAMSGLLSTIQRPLSSIGRIFSDEGSSQPARTPLPGNTPRMSPAIRNNLDLPQTPPRGPTPASARTEQNRVRQTAEEAAARQASAEAAEAQRLQRAEHSNVVETLAGMFPDLDREIISDVVVQKEGRVGLAVDACLALSS